MFSRRTGLRCVLYRGGRRWGRRGIGLQRVAVLEERRCRSWYLGEFGLVVDV